MNRLTSKELKRIYRKAYNRTDWFYRMHPHLVPPGFNSFVWKQCDAAGLKAVAAAGGNARWLLEEPWMRVYEEKVQKLEHDLHVLRKSRYELEEIIDRLRFGKERALRFATKVRRFGQDMGLAWLEMWQGIKPALPWLLAFMCLATAFAAGMVVQMVWGEVPLP